MHDRDDDETSLPRDNDDEEDLVGPRRGGAWREPEDEDEDLVGPRRVTHEPRSGVEDEAPRRRSILDDEDAADVHPVRRPRRRGREDGRGGMTVATFKAILRDIPAFLKLLARLARDPRVSTLDKAVVAAVLVYLVSPIDLIPDWIAPVVGQVEDVYFLALALGRLLNNAGMDVLLDHWDGDEATLELALNALDGLSSFLPAPVRAVLGHREA